MAERTELFVTTFELKRWAMPYPTTYRRVLARAVAPSDLERLVGDFLAQLPSAGVPVHIALDGKTLRGTLTGGEKRGLHLLAAYWPEAGLVLCQMEVAPRTNEIGAARLVLKTLDLKGKIITGDALLAQRDLSLLSVKTGGDYVWTVKDNQLLAILNNLVPALLARRLPQLAPSPPPFRCASRPSHSATRRLTSSRMRTPYYRLQNRLLRFGSMEYNEAIGLLLLRGAPLGWLSGMAC